MIDKIICNAFKVDSTSVRLLGEKIAHGSKGYDVEYSRQEYRGKCHVNGTL